MGCTSEYNGTAYDPQTRILAEAFRRAMEPPHTTWHRDDGTYTPETCAQDFPSHAARKRLQRSWLADNARDIPDDALRAYEDEWALHITEPNHYLWSYSQPSPVMVWLASTRAA
jgi:hypothetical protein